MPAPAYTALALQTTCFAVNGLDASTARAQMMKTIARLAAQIVASKRFLGQDVRLVVLPEYFLTGFPMGETAAVWAETAAIDVDGPEYAALREAARSADIHLAGNAYERDVHFPGLYFQTSFLIDPAGALVLRYRRLISLFGPSPYDVYDRYVDVYGVDALFPVAETEIGRVAAIASEEILYPEIARILALRGAEVFVHSSSEVGSNLATPKNIAKQAGRSKTWPTLSAPTAPGSKASLSQPPLPTAAPRSWTSAAPSLLRRATARAWWPTPNSTWRRCVATAVGRT